MTKLYIFEGADNVGKTTAINNFMRDKDRAYIIRQHHSKPLEGEPPLFRYPPLLKEQLKLNPDFIIWDRGPYSALIYDSYYREAIPYSTVNKVISDIRQLADTTIELIHRPWGCVRPYHVKELAETANDPNNANMLDRRLIHRNWETLAKRLPNYVTVRNVLC